MKQIYSSTINPRIYEVSRWLVIHLVLPLFFIFLFLPLFLTLDNLFAKIAEQTFFFRVIENVLVPYEEVLVGTLLKLAGVPILEGTVEVIKNGQSLKTYISWNCIGWQSFVILGISLWGGFSKKYTRFSKIEVLLIGFLGTFIFNVIRIALILAILYYFGGVATDLTHKYGAVLLSMFWLAFFWWFSYKYVLEERSDKRESEY
ncbi:MAG: exosortase/archaeosortase family protein [Candidatus Curtissbacteria bacterium]|nr:exosortase/archaeosortase family protein [Candidatus Curtissbacteria bacterium]